MATGRFVLNSNDTKYIPKYGAVSIVRTNVNPQPNFVKSQLTKRSSSDLKQSRVSAYKYLIP